jgi:cytoskeletal protein RodZ
MESIGNQLREARERLGFTLEEVERSTHIRKVRLEALERGDFDSLPSRVQAQGFLRNYAEFLGLETELLLNAFSRGELTSSKAARAKGRKDRGKSVPRIGQAPARRIRIYSDQILTGGVALAVIALLVWGANRIVASINQTPGAAGGEIVGTTQAPSATFTGTPQLAGLGTSPILVTPDLDPTMTATLALGLVDSIELELVADQSAFVQVLVDGREEYQGRMQAGESVSFRAEDRVEVTTGNARGLRVYFNGQDQGFLGEVNQVLTRIWTIRGMQTPTATPSLTATASPPVSETPSATITPVTQAAPGSG